MAAPVHALRPAIEWKRARLGRLYVLLPPPDVVLHGFPEAS